MQRNISQEKASSTMKGNDIEKSNKLAKAAFSSHCQLEQFDPL